MELKDVEAKDEDYEVLEAQFLEIQTSGGFVTIKNYNSHNGYYGGFRLWLMILVMSQNLRLLLFKVNYGSCFNYYDDRGLGGCCLGLDCLC